MEVSMALYLVSYDLMAPGKDYKDLWAALRAIKAVRILESEWLTRREGTTPLALANHILQYMDSNDKIFVTEVPNNYAYRLLLSDPAKV
jgi:hypothetical protein